jgi:hypothetical protein
MLPGQLTEELALEVLMFTKLFGRANWEALDAQEEENEKAPLEVE